MMIRPFAQIFAIAISNGVNGMTSRWSIVPCSRSRTSAAPASTIASIVTLLRMPIMPVNQDVSTLGLKAIRTSRLIGDARRALRPRQEVGDLGRDDLLRVIGADAGLHHRRRIDVELDRGLAAGQNVAREIRWDVEHERIAACIHRRDDVAFGDQVRRLKIGREERMRDPPRQCRMVLVNDSDRGVVHFLRTALRLRDDREREA